MYDSVNDMFLEKKILLMKLTTPPRQLLLFGKPAKRACAVQGAQIEGVVKNGISLIRLDYPPFVILITYFNRVKCN